LWNYEVMAPVPETEALNVTVELVRRGYSEKDIDKIWGGNLLLVWRQVEKRAAQK